MRHYKIYIIGLIFVLGISVIGMAQQQVRIEIPIDNIINKTEFSITRNVMHTGNDDKWDNMKPSIWALNNEFQHKDVSGVTTGNTLATSVLFWQLDNIGGKKPKFHHHDVLPDFQHFSTSPQTWYGPHSSGGSSFSIGNVVFKFKIPGTAFANNTFHPGEYTLNVKHNSERDFNPSSIQVILVVPELPSGIEWKSNNSTVYHQISSLGAFSTSIEIPIGNTQIANSVDFNLWAKTNGPIQVTSSDIDPSSIPSQHIKLASTNSSKIATLPLSDVWKNYTPNGPFTVIPGNVNTFDLNFSIEQEALKTYFFQAGAYTFQLNLDARSTDGAASALQNTEVTIDVLPLSEITISTGQEVNFEFYTASHYQQGQSKMLPKQLKLSNNEIYELQVKSSAAFFNKDGVQSNIPSSILEVGINGVNSVPLSTTSKKLIPAGPPVLDRELDMKYSISPAAAKSLMDKDKTTYSINVIYSFTAL